MGYAGYFLSVWDCIRFARERGISVGPGRGSAAGSLAAYALGITNIDPLRYGLLFERFLNPERVSMPDMDIDFSYERRDEVINYVTEKFADEVLKLTDGRGVDLILDAVGKPTFEEGLRCLAPFGHLILYGRAGGPTDPLNVATLSAKSQKVSGFMVPTVTRNFPDKTRESAERCFALMRGGRPPGPSTSHKPPGIARLFSPRCPGGGPARAEFGSTRSSPASPGRTACRRREARSLPGTPKPPRTARSPG
jgi:hypothetical protein